MKKRLNNTKLIFTTIIILLICVVSINIGIDHVTGNLTWRPSFNWFRRITPTDDVVTVTPTKPIIVAPVKPTTACKDIDGENEFEKSYVNYNNKKYEDYCVQKVGVRTGSSFLSRFRISYYYNKVSSCTGKDCYVNEYICSNDKVSYKRVQCENGCSNGACIKEEVEKECFFAEEIKQPSYCPEGNCKILIIAESEIYSLIKNSLTTFSSDLKKELGFNVKLKTLTRKSDETYVKTMIMDEYDSGSLKGVFLVGNIPTTRINIGGGWDVALSDQQYYQDVLDKCQYLSNLDAYSCENIPRPFLPPYWVSRIISPIEIKDNEPYPDDWTKEQKLNYLKELKKENYFLGQNKNDEILPSGNLVKKLTVISEDAERANIINQYFNYNHLYRTNKISTIKEPILYTPVENDDLDQAKMSKQLIKENLLKAGYKQENIHFLNSGINENKEFLEAIKKPYEFAFINAHGTSNWHQYGINKDVLKEPNALIVSPTSCSVGNFRDPDFIAGHYLMDGKTQFLTAGSVPIFGALHIDEGYILSLTSGKRIFEAWEFEPTSINWFGDPTIKMRYITQAPRKEGPKICISHDKLNFGNILKNSEKISFKIYNKGGENLKISTIHDLAPQWLFFDEKLPKWEGGSMFEKGGTSKNFNLENDGSYLEFNIGINQPYVATKGNYKGFIYLVSNDINNPVLKIPLSFKI